MRPLGSPSHQTLSFRPQRRQSSLFQRVGREARMEEFAGVSGVWTTGGCEEESAGAVEVVISFCFLFFLLFTFFWERDLWDLWDGG